MTVGSLAGTSLWYLAARRLDRDQVFAIVNKHGWWLTISREGMEKADQRLKRHEEFAVFAGRMLPGVRTLISAPAGLMNMPFWRFLGLPTAGTVIWTSLMTVAGYLFGSQYDKVQGWINSVTSLMFVLIILTYVVRLMKGKGMRQAAG